MQDKLSPEVIIEWLHQIYSLLLMHEFDELVESHL